MVKLMRTFRHSVVLQRRQRHHALMEAQRYPEDYDGIVAGAFAGIDWTALMFGELWTGVNSSVKGPDFDLPQPQLNLLTGAVLEQCAGTDGGVASDAFLNDPRQCRFDPHKLQCKSGQDPSTCLTASQLQAVDAIYQGASNPRTHHQIWPGFVAGSETFWRQVLVGNPSAPGGSSASFFRDGVFAGQSGFDFLNINFDSDVALSDRAEIAAVNAVNPDLRRFFARGGKLLLVDGWNDTSVPPKVAINYYRAVVEKTGDKQVRESMRFFMVPGMGHGPGTAGVENFNYDALGVIEQWKQTGKAPEELTFDHYKDGMMVGKRLVCQYPKVPTYKGSGNTEDTSSFVCK